MNPALWASKTGLDAQQTRMTVVANNLANVNTTGFKRQRPVFEELLCQNVRQVGAQTSQDTEYPTGMYLGTGVRVVATEKLYTQGSLQQTGSAFDLAVQGRGFFQVLMPDGSTAYTRDGSFQVNADGQLVTMSGLAIMRFGRQSDEVGMGMVNKIIHKVGAEAVSMVVKELKKLHKLTPEQKAQILDKFAKPRLKAREARPSYKDLERELIAEKKRNSELNMALKLANEQIDRLKATVRRYESGIADLLPPPTDSRKEAGASA